MACSTDKTSLVDFQEWSTEGKLRFSRTNFWCAKQTVFDWPKPGELHRTKQNSDSSILSQASLIFNKTTITFLDTLSKDSRKSCSRYHWEHLYLSNFLAIFVTTTKIIKNHVRCKKWYHFTQKLLTYLWRRHPTCPERSRRWPSKGGIIVGLTVVGWLIDNRLLEGRGGWFIGLVGWLIMIRISNRISYFYEIISNLYVSKKMFLWENLLSNMGFHWQTL